MNAFYTLQSVPLKLINREDRFYKLHNHQEKKADFFQRNPLLQPVWLKRLKTDNYQIVDGFSIIMNLLNQNHIKEIPAMVFLDSQSSLDLWIYRVQKRKYENNISPFSFLEAVINLKSKGFEIRKNHEMEQLFREIGFRKPANIHKHLNKLGTLLPYIEQFTQPHLLGTLEIEQLLSKTLDELKTLAKLLRGLTLKGNKLLTLLQMLGEIEAGYQHTLQSILNTNPLLLENQDRPDNYRYNLIKNLLYRIRFPKLSKMEGDWEDLRKRLNFKKGITMDHDPYFEGEKLQIQIVSSSSEELDQLLQNLYQTLNTDGREEIFKRL